MKINKEIIGILKKFKIDPDQGLLCLLGFYHNLDVDKIVPEEVVKAINLTKIVTKDYNNKDLNWNIALFEDQNIDFDWVGDWMTPFGKINPERRGVKRDCIARMKKFFAANPVYRKEDVYKARDLYIATIKDPQYIKSSHKFIYDGAGDFKSSLLLQWCEKLKEDNSSASYNLKGLVK